jgi:hypothetical protein
MSFTDKNEKNDALQREDAAEGQPQLPPGATVSAQGVPTYAGLSGNALIWVRRRVLRHTAHKLTFRPHFKAITAASSCGFGLFGYVRVGPSSCEDSAAKHLAFNRTRE